MSIFNVGFDRQGTAVQVRFQKGGRSDLGPELDAITSFTFGNPTLAVTRMGHMAFGRETYTYRIELADGRVIDREGVATSVLTHDADGWKIVHKP